MNRKIKTYILLLLSITLVFITGCDQPDLQEKKLAKGVCTIEKQENYQPDAPCLDEFQAEESVVIRITGFGGKNIRTRIIFLDSGDLAADENHYIMEGKNSIRPYRFHHPGPYMVQIIEGGRVRDEWIFNIVEP